MSEEYEKDRDTFLRYMQECLSSPEYEESFNKHYDEFFEQVDIFFEHDLLGIQELKSQLTQAEQDKREMAARMLDMAEACKVRGIDLELTASDNILLQKARALVD